MKFQKRSKNFTSFILLVNISNLKVIFTQQMEYDNIQLKIGETKLTVQLYSFFYYLILIHNIQCYTKRKGDNTMWKAIVIIIVIVLVLFLFCALKLASISDSEENNYKNNKKN